MEIRYNIAIIGKCIMQELTLRSIGKISFVISKKKIIKALKVYSNHGYHLFMARSGKNNKIFHKLCKK
jgi:hypothetical protein